MLMWTLILGLNFGYVFGGYCNETFACTNMLPIAAVPYPLWDLGLGKMYEIQIKNEGYFCTKTCFRHSCCTGYTGSGCNTPICFGSPIFPNGGTCLYPDVCECQAGFSSPNCDDTDECTDTAHGCHHNCVNTPGSYHCTCRSGYILNSNHKFCLDVRKTSVVSTIIVNLSKDKAVLDQMIYTEIGKMMERYFMTATNGNVSVSVNKISEGRAIAEYTVAYYDEENVDSKADIVKAIIDLAEGDTLMLDGKLVQVQSILPNTSTDPCDIRKVLAGPCKEGLFCVVDGNKPYCRNSSMREAIISAGEQEETGL